MKEITKNISFTKAQTRSAQVYFNEVSMCTRRICKLSNEELSRDQLITKHLGFVITVAKHYQTKGLDLMDLVSAGNLGLVKAVDHMKQPLSCSFTAYALPWIQHEIILAVQEIKHIVHVPRRPIEILESYRKMVEKIDHLDFDFTGFINFLVAYKEELRGVCAQDIHYFDELVDAEEGLTLGEILPSDSTADVALDNTEKSRQIKNLLIELFGPRKADFFIKLYSLDGEFHSIGMLCEEFDMDERQVKASEARILLGLRYSNRGRELRELLA